MCTVGGKSRAQGTAVWKGRALLKENIRKKAKKEQFSGVTEQSCANFLQARPTEINGVWPEQIYIGLQVLNSQDPAPEYRFPPPPFLATYMHSAV